MNGLSKNFNIKLLHGITLLQVSIGKNQFVLHFDNEIEICLECDCIYIASNGKKIFIKNYIKSASLVCSFIDTKVLDAMLDKNGGLIVKFSNNAILHFFNDSVLYEAFQIKIRGNVVYVA